jgi:hypothetical protein
MGTRKTSAQTSAETGLPGRPSILWLPKAKEEGLPGRMAIFQKPSSPPRFERRSDQIEAADRGAADRDEDIGLPRRGPAPECFPVVASDAEALPRRRRAASAAIP